MEVGLSCSQDMPSPVMLMVNLDPKLGGTATACGDF